MVTQLYDFLTDRDLFSNDMSNKLFCTFAQEDNLRKVINTIQNRYTIIYGKIFILYSKSQNEYACTYNVDLSNVSSFLDNTILVHRKKDSNTLYTINALNTLIKQLNNGMLDTNYAINWKDYKNCILLTRGEEIKQINTKLFEIIEV
jgi:hypothetical protein